MLIHVLLMSSRDLGKFDIPQTEIPARTKKTGSLLAKFYTTFTRCGSWVPDWWCVGVSIFCALNTANSFCIGHGHCSLSGFADVYM